MYEYLWNESKLVGQKVGNDAVRILYDANDEPVGFTVNDSASYFYVKNLQGDVLAIVDKTGAEKVSYVYDAYGQIVSMTGDATLQKLNPCTYRGYYYDAETGLYYLQSRYYNPEWGRFINADKTEVLNITNNVKQANLYIYAENNPINYIDSSGDFGTPLQWAMAVIGGIAVSLLGVAIIVWGVIEVICLFLNYSQTETSNDAQIEQYVSPINLRASGYIDKIYFTEHQEVRKGDTLLVLDDREYKIRVMEAEAALKDAQAGATVINATLNTTQTTATVYDASIAEIEVRLAKLEKDRKRYENLVERKAATPIQLEQIVTDYEATRKKLEAVKRQKKAALSGVDEVSYRRVSTEAAIQRATAALEMARLNLSYTVVVAPCDGKLGRRSLEEGQFIAAGQTITYILPNTQKWIVANYKETQIENLSIGQEVSVTVDAISDKEFKGKVTSISGATGSKYSLVPTDNSAGNFVKIQQRIPVRIDFTDLSKEDNERLAAGMMVVVKAKL